MPDFKPYTIVEESATRLYIKEPLWRQRIYFFVFRVFPFFFLLQAIIIVTLMKKEIDLPKFALPGIVLATSIPPLILFTRKYVTDVDISALSFELKRNTFRGKETLTYLVADIDHISCKIKRGKGAGYYYYLRYKPNGRMKRFMTIYPIAMNSQKQQYIADKLQDVTGLKVIHS